MENLVDLFFHHRVHYKLSFLCHFSTEGQGDQPATYTSLLNDLEISNPKLLGE